MRFLQMRDMKKWANKLILGDDDSCTSSVGLMFLGLPLLIALGLYSVHVTGSLYGDEESTFRVVSQGNLFANLNSPDLCHPPLFFVAAKLCYAATGLPWSIRIPSVLSAFVAVMVVGRLASYLYGTGVARWALWLAALSPLLVELAAEGRPYAMLALFSVGAVYFLLRFIERENWRSMVPLAAVLAGGLLTHYIFVVYATFAGGYYLARKRTLTRYSLCVVLLLVPILLFLLLGVMHNASNSAGFGALFPKSPSVLINFVARLPIAMSFGYSTFRLPELDFARYVEGRMIRENAVLVSVTAFALSGGALIVIRSVVERRKWIVFLVCSIAVPTLLLLLGVLAGAFAAREKYLIGILGTYVILAAVAFYGASRSVARFSVASTYFLVVLVSLFHYTLCPNVYSRRMDWDGLKTLLSTELRSGDILLLYRVERAATRQINVNAEGVRLVDVQAEIQRGRELDEIAQELAAVRQGRIVFVNNGVHQVYVDPARVVIRHLRTQRSFEKHPFGRNLSVYIFTP